MSAAGSQVRQGAAAAARAPSQQPAARAAVRPAPAQRFESDSEDEFRLNLHDLPQQRESLEIDGLKPSLLSRLFNLVSPLR